MVRGTAKVRKREFKQMAKFSEMTEQEKREYFEKWVSGREERRGKSKVKRAAMDALKKLHLEEYNKLYKQMEAQQAAKATPKAPKATT